jgi:3D (Asp-Asp-Asp) domain-containing protein
MVPLALPLAVVALAVFVAPAVGGANTPRSTASLRAQDAAIAAKSRAAVLGLYSLDERLVGAQTRLATLQAQAHVLRIQHASLEHQLDVARRGTRISQQHLAERLRALYEEGNVEPLEVVFGATSLDEALTNLENLDRVAGQGEDVLRDLTHARTSLRAASNALARRRRALAESTREARATAEALVETRSNRNAYISSLGAQRRLTQRQIADLVARAHAAQVQSAQIVRTSLADARVRPAEPARSGTQTVTVTATGYSLAGHTASGLPVGWGVVAVDPSLIPLGTHMTIPGYGDAVAADTGGAVVGATIDLWFPTLAQANAWGRRSVTIVLR